MRSDKQWERSASSFRILSGVQGYDYCVGREDQDSSDSSKTDFLLHGNAIHFMVGSVGLGRQE